jgi:hypothetical protein
VAKQDNARERFRWRCHELHKPTGHTAHGDRAFGLTASAARVGDDLYVAYPVLPPWPHLPALPGRG